MNRFLVALLGLFVVISSCSKEESFEMGTPAKGSLQSLGGECMPKIVHGTYSTGQALTDSNYVTVTIEVTGTGNYNIKSDTLNGFSFSGTGSFTGTGITTINLKASGTPAAAGINNFTIVFDSSACTFPVEAVAGTGGGGGGGGSANTSYFPLTANSYWTYDQDGTDTLKTLNSYSQTITGNSYRAFVSTYQSGTKDTSFYRKDASNNFYNYVSAADLQNAAGGIPITFPAAGLDILFMKETLTTNATWNSDHSGTVSGFPVTIRFKFTVVNAAATVTVNSVSYSNVYQISMEPQFGTAGVFQPAGSAVTFYYAKGIGLIKLDDGTSTQNIRYYQVF